ncbi:MAG: hypothetical protein HZC28_09705 [Spirochaetes bacterium]|nr:hypothetical protein [Spirochaetota bacterium]
MIGIALRAEPAGVITVQIDNPGFENGFSKSGIANRWSDNSFKAEVIYREEKTFIHSGGSAQRIDCTRLDSGRVQCCTPVAVQKAKLHTVSIWLAASEPLRVSVLLRMAGKPYKSYAVGSFKVSTGWQEYRFSEIVDEDDSDARLFIIMEQPGTLWVDDVSCVIETGISAAVFSPPAKPVPATLFGLHYSPYNPHQRQTVTDSHPWPAIPFKNLRLHDSDVSWNWLEKEKGKWNWDVLDNYLSLAAEHTIDLHYVLAFSPTWASARPGEIPIYGKWWMGCAAEAANIDDWRNFVRTVVTRCKGKVKYYEGWNEPDIRGFYSGSKTKLIELQKEMYLIVKEIDPAAQVISPSCAAAGTAYLDELLELGLGSWIDAVGFHFYSGGMGPERTIPRIELVQKIMKNNRCQKPLFNTEAGWSIASSYRTNVTAGVDTKKVLPIETAAYCIARAYLINWAMGIPVFNLYRWEGGMGLREDNDELKEPCVKAYSNVAAWMTGAVMTSCARDAEGTYTVKLARDGRIATVIWNTEKSAEISVPENTGKITGILGDAIQSKSGILTVGEAPVIIE